METNFSAQTKFKKTDKNIIKQNKKHFIFF